MPAGKKVEHEMADEVPLDEMSTRGGQYELIK
jgi:hypothetical protein